ncbi:MAG: 4-hydroxybutyrate dehydrogenase [Acutalibacteraceae bacterium]
MIQLICEPKIHKFDSCGEFIEAFKPDENDLMIVNPSVYEPYFEKYGLKTRVISPNKYGRGEPTDVMAEAIMKDMGDKTYKRIFAVGGGTVIDLAKVFSVRSDGRVDPIYDAMPDLERRSELIVVPTTCGTGSEVTNIAILTRTKLGTKMGIVSPAIYPAHAVLIPELLENLPLEVFATSSFDALTHAVESCLSPSATPFTKLFAYKAIEILVEGFKKIAKEGNTAESRRKQTENFLIASCFAGLSFGTAGCAAVHAMAYPLGGIYHVPHGESNYALLTGVLKNYYEMKQDGEIAVLNAYLAKLLGCEEEKAYDELEKVLDVVLPKKPLHEYGVKEEELRDFAESVIKNQTRLMKNSFVPLDTEKVLKIYKELY